MEEAQCCSSRPRARRPATSTRWKYLDSWRLAKARAELSGASSMLSDGDSSDSNGPDLPAGVLRSRGGWQGDTLEIEHQRERIRSGADDAEKKAPINAAVDLSQFRNEEVGKGYQAKHVVRQREANLTATGVVDMSGGQFAKKDRGAESSSKKRSHDDGDKGDKDRRKNPPVDTRLESYLQCKGMRDFMKEISQILKR